MLGCGRRARSRWLPAAEIGTCFAPFLDRGLWLLNEGGIWAQVVPNKLLAADYSSAIQKRIGECTLLAIRDYSRTRLFDAADVYPIVPVIAKRRMAAEIEIEIMAGSKPADLRIAQQWRVPRERLPACRRAAGRRS